MSTINTNGIDGNYPTPGQNNSSEGFRDNFTAIKNNLNTAGTEITELQDKAVLKQGLNSITLDNNMANTLISNAAIRTFRNTTYNLGNNVSGTVVVDCTLGDVQFATITGDTTFQLAGWSPTATKHTITLDLTISNTLANLNFPATVSGTLLENNTLNSGNLQIATAPYGAGRLVYDLSTVDCGNSILIEPVNRPYQTSQIEIRDANTPTGYQGDRNGDIAVAPVITPITVTATTITTNIFTVASTTGFYIGMPIQFTAQGGGIIFGGPVGGTTYYVSAIVADTSFVVTTDAELTLPLTLSTASGTMQASPIAYTYICVGNFDSNVTVGNAQSVTSNVLTVGATSIANTFWANQPIVFSGANVTNAGIVANTPYYVKTAPTTTTMTLSRTRIDGGVAGPTVELTDTTSLTNVVATIYVQGHDIWKRVTLDSF